MFTAESLPPQKNPVIEITEVSKVQVEEVPFQLKLGI